MRLPREPRELILTAPTNAMSVSFGACTLMHAAMYEEMVPGTAPLVAPICRVAWHGLAQDRNLQ